MADAARATKIWPGPITTLDTILLTVVSVGVIFLHFWDVCLKKFQVLHEEVVNAIMIITLINIYKYHYISSSNFMLLISCNLKNDKYTKRFL